MAVSSSRRGDGVAPVYSLTRNNAHQIRGIHRPRRPPVQRLRWLSASESVSGLPQSVAMPATILVSSMGSILRVIFVVSLPQSSLPYMHLTHACTGANSLVAQLPLLACAQLG